MNAIERYRGLDDWEVVTTFLPHGWEQAARTCGALRRTRGVCDAQTLLRVLLVHLADGCSLQETAVRARQAGWCTLSAVAIFKRLQAAEQWLRWMAEQLWRRQSAPVDRSGYRVRAVDATSVSEPGSTGSDWRVHYAIDLGNLQCDFFELTDVSGGETFRRVPVQAGDLILGDRAYGTPPGVRHVVDQGGAVLTRINLQMLPLYTASGRKISILQRLRTLRVGRVGQWPSEVIGSDGAIRGRLIGIKRGRQASQQARLRLRRTAKRQQRSISAEALAAAGYVFVWTCVPASRLSPQAVLELYRVRWQIELAFKRMKSIMGLGQLPKHADASARAWLHGKLLIAMLIERLLEEADSFSPWGYRLGTASQPLA